MHALLRASISITRSSSLSYRWPDTVGKVLYSQNRCYSSSVVSQDLLFSKAHSAPFPSRTHTCGGLSARDAGSRVVLTGWLLPERKGGRVSFFPLKDSYGTVQLIVNHSEACEDLAALSDVPVESSVLIEGQVLLRPPSARRPGLTGEIDVQVDKFILLNAADRDLPFTPSNVHNVPNEDLRLRYRYLDLRRSTLSDNLRKRSQVAHLVRNCLHDDGFVEVETPVLLRSSPEGAREFLVPTRSKNATDDPAFYALQQSPQQPKQLLIASGSVDKYFQIAKCFRDEDGRKDRQPEFTQIDMEMAYVSWGPKESLNSQAPRSLNSDEWRIGGSEVRDVVETIIKKIWKQVEHIELPSQFPVMTYHEAMTRFGSDKPDVRFGLEMTDLAPYLSTFEKETLKDETLEAIIIRKSRDPGFWQSARKCDLAPSIEPITLTEKNASDWLRRCKNLVTPLSPEAIGESRELELNKALSLSPGDTVWLARRPLVPAGGSTILGRQRLKLLEAALAAETVKLPEAPHFLWITEFPLFTRSDDDKDFLARGRWSSSHHPFTAPMWQDVQTLYEGKDVESVRGQHYDLVLNGVEIGGGSVRVHDASLQEHIFTNVLKLSEQEKAPFNHLLHALRCGAPPHGGIALGFDRLMSILCNTSSIRDVIAFPKTAGGADLLFKSPAPIGGGAGIAEEGEGKGVLDAYGLMPLPKTRR